MEFIFVFAVIFIQIFLFDLPQIVKIVGTFRIDVFVDAEEFTVFLGNKSIAAMRAYEAERSSSPFSARERTCDFIMWERFFIPRKSA